MTTELQEFLDELADLNNHHIEGFAVMGNTPFDVVIVTQVDGNLWQGGYLDNARLPDYFKFVLSLYPWQRYQIGPHIERREERLFDRPGIPDSQLLEDLASWINEKRALGPTLVHCQAGLNRSALVTGLALIRSGMTPPDAIALLRKRSPAVLCNESFESWLLEQ